MSEAITSVADSSSEVKSREKYIVRFWTKVNKNGPVPEHVPELGPCWVWTGKPDKDGYALFRENKRQWRANRFVFSIDNELIAGKVIMHLCDNRMCVHPQHLVQGTPIQNTEDMVAKRRHAFGERNGMKIHPDSVLRGSQNAMSKLVEANIIEIRSAYATGGISQPTLARKWGVTHVLIGKIVRREIWKHVD